MRLINIHTPTKLYVMKFKDLFISTQRKICSANQTYYYCVHSTQRVFCSQETKYNVSVVWIFMNIQLKAKNKLKADGNMWWVCTAKIMSETYLVLHQIHLKYFLCHMFYLCYCFSLHLTVPDRGEQKVGPRCILCEEFLTENNQKSLERARQDMAWQGTRN